MKKFELAIETTEIPKSHVLQHGYNIDAAGIRAYMNGHYEDFFTSPICVGAYPTIESATEAFNSAKSNVCGIREIGEYLLVESLYITEVIGHKLIDTGIEYTSLDI